LLKQRTNLLSKKNITTMKTKQLHN
jgi:hypothetical protein